MGFFRSLGHNKAHRAGGRSGPDSASHQDYEAPVGPPPRQQAGPSGDDKPPPAPPPSYNAPSPCQRYNSQQQQQQPYHDWTSVPDTSLLPPPPSIQYSESPTGNAEESEGVRANLWCQRYPLMLPQRPTHAQAAAVRDGDILLQRPREYSGSLDSRGLGHWRGTTRDGCRDCSLLSSLPLYFAEIDSPSDSGMDKTVYFELKILSIGSRSYTGESALAIGYCAVPYPTWRMPGWERGSFAVHSDDGRRYVSDPDGGVDFTSPFRVGETVGLGIRFAVPASKGMDPAPAPTHGPDGEVYFTRNGRRTAGWNVHEETDAAKEFGALGIDGTYDLFGAIGVYGSVSFEAVFDPRLWLFRP